MLSRDLRKKTIRKKFLDSPLVSNIDFSDDFKLKLRQSWEKLIDDQIWAPWKIKNCDEWT